MRDTLRAVIYARYSSDNQREESIEGQLRECKEFAAKNDLEIVGTYIDRALSARTDNRPDFKRMIQESCCGIFDVVLVWKLDRFSRSRYDSALYKKLLEQNGVKLVSATEPISEGPEGILIGTIFEGMAEYYSAELAVKVRRSMKENALKAKWNGGSVPLGYTVDKKEQKLIIDPDSVEIVKTIFRLAYDGCNVKEIHRYLEDHSITRPNGKPIRYNAVRYILSNRVYIGEYNHSGVVHEDAIPSIIEKHMFYAVQDELKKNSKAPARHTADDDYLLTTKLFCGKCGSMMVAQAGTSHTGNVYRYYACTQQKKHKCDMKMLPKEKLENYVVHRTMELISQDDIVDELAQLLYSIQDNENSILPVLMRQLQLKEKEIANMVDAIAQGVASKALMERLTKCEDEKREIEESYAKESIKTPNFTVNQYKMALANYRKVNMNTLDGKRKIINTFINAIFVYDDHLKIVYNGNNKEETISLAALENSSNLFSPGAPKHSNPNLLPIGEMFGFVVYLDELK